MKEAREEVKCFCGNTMVFEWIQITDQFDGHYVCIECRKKNEKEQCN
tara:strand:+ start:1813 stop:1953 length:141 start_codon:yes stop_codon:yes gene_type:complete